MICSICKKEFQDNEIELSHDIPKYLGGTDADGRHYLCKECHDLYELKILATCLIKYFSILIHRVDVINDRRFLIPYMNLIKNSPNLTKVKCILEAEEIKREVFGNGSS